MKSIILSILAIFLPFIASAESVFDNFKIGEPGNGKANPWQINFQQAASPVMARLEHLHSGLLWMCLAICLLVLGLLAWIAIRYNSKANPVPSKTTHNTLIEIIWTAIPVMILVAIVIPSWRAINYMEKAEKPEMTLKAIGFQWYWGYEYMDGIGEGIKFESYMKLENPPKGQENLQLLEGEPRLLSADKNLVLPVNTNIRILTTAADVIHAFAVPAFGVKKDAVPGRINETWVTINKPGMYYGQCSELCGSKHAFMPIAVEAVSKRKYRKWVNDKKEELGITEPEEETNEVSANKADAKAVKPADKK